MINIWLYTLASVIGVSVISLIGIFTLSMKMETLKKAVTFMISFAAGALIGDVFIHLLPEITENAGFTLAVSLTVIAGIGSSFIIEKIIHWRHCHHPTTPDHPHPFAWMNLYGESVHNFIDGLIIGAAYLVSVPVGLATTFAVVLHEIPTEIGDFGVLVHGGFSRAKALLMNFLVSLTTVAGAILALSLNAAIGNLTAMLIPFAAGNFIYIAMADLIPELHKETHSVKSLVQLILFGAGVAVMSALLLLE